MNQDPTGGGVHPAAGDAVEADLRGRPIGSSYLLVRPTGPDPAGLNPTGSERPGPGRSAGEAVAVELLPEGRPRLPGPVIRFVRERTVLLMLRHRAVVRVRDLVSAGAPLGLVLDLVPAGRLRDRPWLTGPGINRVLDRLGLAPGDAEVGDPRYVAAADLITDLAAATAAGAVPSGPPDPAPAEPPQHPSWTGVRLPPPHRRNQPAGWRWGRP